MELLEKHFEIALETPDGIKKLREMILSLAMQGKLVPQDPNDQSASALLKVIEVEKKQLSKEVKIKGKEQVPPDDSIENPYDLPKVWAWCRIGDICYDWGQKVPNKKFTYIDVGSIDNTNGIISPDVQVLSAEEAPSRARKIVKKGTVIYSTVRPYLLNIAIVEEDYNYEPIASTAFAIMHTFSCVFNRYLYYYLHSPFFVNYVQSQMKGVAYPAINDRKFFQGPIPIPPLNEQKRIVVRIDQLRVLCDKLEAERNERNSKRFKVHTAAINNLLSASDKPEFKKSWNFITKNFGELYSVPENVEELKKAILQLAVMGKLVPQDPNDQPVSALLKEIESEKKQLFKEGKVKKPESIIPLKQEEIPYTLPKGWIWVRLGNILNKIIGGGTPSKNNSLYWNGNIPWASVKDMNVDIYLEKTLDSITLEGVKNSSTNIIPKNNIIICTRMGLGKIAINKIEVAINQDLKALFISSCIDQMFFFRKFQSYEIIGQGVTVKGIRQEELLNYPFPLPPLAEQKRIIAKIDQLMGICNTLQQQLNDSTNKKASILNGVLQKYKAQEYSKI